MQKMNKKANGRGAKRVNQDADCYMKPIRPSKAMMEALEMEGLRIDWPDDIFTKIRGTFSTKSGSEHAVMLDFSYMKDSAKTSEDIDKHIAQCLYEAWMEYTWMVELDWGDLAELNSTNKLAWDTVISLLVDYIQKERHLSRFFWVASSVIDGEPVPPKEQMQGYCETVHIAPTMAGEIRDCLIKAYPNVKGSPCAKNIKDIIDTIAWKLEIKESFNEKTGVPEPRAKNAIRLSYKPMPQLHLLG